MYKSIYNQKGKNMSNYNSLKTIIDANIKQNGNQEITGQILNSVLNAIVTTLGVGYQFAGVATIATKPGSPDAKVFYIANGKGTYTNFSGIEVTEDDVVVLYWDSSWHKVSTGIASQAKLSELESEFATKQDIIPDLDTIRAGAALGASSLQKETDPSVPSWAKAATKPSYTPAEIGAASEDSLQSHENDNTRHITEIERTEWNAKQEALTLTVKDNGNIVLANIQGQSKEFMPATPSGDPMHYAYVAAGAEYNDTGADIVKTAPWADMVDDDYTGEYGKTVVHKAGYWHLNGLGDITNDEIRKIYQLTSTFPEGLNLQERFRSTQFRTNFCNKRLLGGYASLRCDGLNANNNKCIVFSIFNVQTSSNIDWAFMKNNKLIHIIGEIVKPNSTSIFSNDSIISTVKIKSLTNNIEISSLNLSMKSVLYMINNEAATSPITITLHANVYNRCMANADILTALQAHTNISLASPES